MRKTGSILEELNKISIDKDRNHVVESRAQHIIESAINLIDQINEYYSPDQSKDLTNRLLNSIKGKDTTKFSRGIKKIIKESQRDDYAD